MARGATAEAQVKVVERNGVPHAACPTCSKNYPLEDPERPSDHIPVEMPRTCKRCGGPMDYEKAREYGEQLAQRDHQPALTNIGNRMRAAVAAGAAQA